MPSAYSRDLNNTDLFNKFQSVQEHLNTTVEKSKPKHYSRLSDKLLDSKASPKSYWSILKIPCIPYLLHSGKFIIGFKEKAELFNDFFQISVLLLITTVNFPRF